MRRLGLGLAAIIAALTGPAHAAIVSIYESGVVSPRDNPMNYQTFTMSITYNDDMGTATKVLNADGTVNGSTTSPIAAFTPGAFTVDFSIDDQSWHLSGVNGWIDDAPNVYLTYLSNGTDFAFQTYYEWSDQSNWDFHGPITRNSDQNVTYLGWPGGGYDTSFLTLWATELKVSSSGDLPAWQTQQLPPVLPEPETWALFMAGIGMMGATIRKRFLSCAW